MGTSSLPTGTVSSGRDEQAPPGSPPTPRRQAQDVDRSPRVRELQRENETLRAAVEQQRQKNECIVERYERLLQRERKPRTGAESRREDGKRPTNRGDETGLLGRLAAALGFR